MIFYLPGLFVVLRLRKWEASKQDRQVDFVARIYKDVKGTSLYLCICQKLPYGDSGA
jgi:hypothetical protein